MPGPRRFAHEDETVPQPARIAVSASTATHLSRMGSSFAVLGRLIAPGGSGSSGQNGPWFLPYAEIVAASHFYSGVKYYTNPADPAREDDGLFGPGSVT